VITEYELYTDERYHLNRYLMLGGIICTNKRRELLLENLRQIREKFGLTAELRWGKVSNRFLGAYKAWVDVFLKDPFARFTLLVINMSDPAWKEFRLQPDRKPSRDDKLASVFYQFLLGSFGKLCNTKRWWVYPDEGFFSRDGVFNRVEFLFNRTYKKAFGSKTSRVIRLMQPVDSKKVELIQLTDVLLGVFSYEVVNDTPLSRARYELLNHCIRAIRQNPKTQRGMAKVKVTCWVPPDLFCYP